MLYHLLPQLHPQIPGMNVVSFITFRTAAASLTALVISLLLGPWFIRKLREFQIGQVIRHGDRHRMRRRPARRRWADC